MKKLFYFATAFLFLFSCTKNSPKNPPPCRNIIPIDTFIANHYTDDSKDLYLSEIYNDSSHFNFNNPVLDPVELQDVLGIIQAVYNLQSTESKAVFNQYKIHSRLCNLSHTVSIGVNVSATEIINLANNKIPTGNVLLDNILSTYHFDSVSHMFSIYDSTLPYLRIYTPNIYNLNPIINQLKTISTITMSEIGGRCYGDGDRIIMNRYTDSTLIDFSYGWGDCPSGCMSRYGWLFKVKCGVASFVKNTY